MTEETRNIERKSVGNKIHVVGRAESHMTDALSDVNAVVTSDCNWFRIEWLDGIEYLSSGDSEPVESIEESFGGECLLDLGIFYSGLLE